MRAPRRAKPRTLFTLPFTIFWLAFIKGQPINPYTLYLTTINSRNQYGPKSDWPSLHISEELDASFLRDVERLLDQPGCASTQLSLGPGLVRSSSLQQADYSHLLEDICLFWLNTSVERLSPRASHNHKTLWRGNYQLRHDGLKGIIPWHQHLKITLPLSTVAKPFPHYRSLYIRLPLPVIIC